MARVARAVQPKVIDFVILFPVISSNVIAMGHKGDSMFVHYHADRDTDIVYRFDGISSDQFNEIKHSKSIGKAIIATKIKGVKL